MADVALIHAGIADSRMWTPQLESFGRAHRVIAPDLPGFGKTPYTTDVVDFRAAVRDGLDDAGMNRAALVGTSLGGLVSLGVALESPERVSALVLVGSGIDGGHEWSREMERWDAEEEAALDRGDFDTAALAMLRAWVAGPRRSLDAVDPAIRELVAEMQRNAYELQHGHDVRGNRLDPPAWQRLGDIRVPTLVLTGDEDQSDIHQIADKLANEIPGAERATIADAAHLPNLERPEEFDRIVLGFLEQHGV
jgi:pimeloyl-ACP methyl ester carboxylesterase